MINPRQNTAKLLPRARAMRRDSSDAERKLWNALRNRQLDGLKFRRQLPIGHFIADFACEACRLIVEVDGEQHGDQMDYDKRRTLHLNTLGWRVIRFDAAEVGKDLDSILDTILRDAKP